MFQSQSVICGFIVISSDQLALSPGEPVMTRNITGNSFASTLLIHTAISMH